MEDQPMPDFIANEEPEVNVEESLTSQVSRILDAFHESFDTSFESSLWPEEVFSGVVIARDDEGLWSYPYSDTEGVVTWGDRVRVEVVYQDAETGESVIGNMADDHLSSVSPRDSDVEDNMPDQTIVEEELEVTDDGDEEEVVEETTPTQDTPQVDEGLQEVSAMVDRLGGVAAVESAIQGLQSNQQQERSRLVAQVQGNPRNTFSDEELAQLPVTHLQKLVDSWTTRDYSPMGVQTFSPNDEDAALLANEMPALIEAD
jgi:hypothetical protein